MNFQEQHYAKWNREKISQFWDVYSTIPDLQGSFFIDWASDWMINEIKDFISPKRNYKPKILDLAFGTGTLLNKAWRMGYSCFGIDLSKKRVREASHNFKGIEFRVGSATNISYSDETFDIIVATQLIEHLLDIDIENFFKEVHRCLMKGGYLFLTTRYNEKLVLNYTVCPDCHAIFHIYQHLQSWSEIKLTQKLLNSGFHVVVCRRSNCNEKIPLEHYKVVKILKPLIKRLLGKASRKKWTIFIWSSSKKIIFEI